jgi:pyruvate,water dikinase
LPDAELRRLDEVGGGDVALAGGKAANLGELVRGGFPVPPGFVVTTAAALESDVEAAIAGAYRELGSPVVAVRSSATAEDLPDASFAGQHDTYLHVQGEADLLDAVRRCTDSLRTDHAVRYRAERGYDEDSVTMAVVVQQMAPHEVSGVVFTVDPVSREEGQLLVNAARGTGEALVSGEVVPDQWTARRPDGAVLRFTPARRRPASPFGPRTPERGCLSSDQVRELALLALRVEEHFAGVPQDIEWSYGDGAFHLLQARPITALSGA